MVKEGATRQFAITDSRQNVRAFMDESGALTKATEYTANGEIALDWNSASAPTTTIGYGSLYRDAESGMSYHHHRYYHAKLGKFISRDPIGVQGGLNLYGYVRNNFVNSWDMLGLFGIEICNYWEEVEHLPGYGIKVNSKKECTTIEFGDLFGGSSSLFDEDNYITHAGSSPGGGRGSTPPSKSDPEKTPVTDSLIERLRRLSCEERRRLLDQAAGAFDKWGEMQSERTQIIFGVENGGAPFISEVLEGDKVPIYDTFVFNSGPRLQDTFSSKAFGIILLNRD
ncbi:MAG TPA: RHS repeat-associated core domain-containing protein [Opitutaceae bacterium]|nr:RHS repeat-associated core domain-containing protein [Opitutaceae bacterium]